MEEKTEWPVEIRISTPDLNEIMDVARRLLGLKPNTEMDATLYGNHEFGLKTLPLMVASSFKGKSALDLISSLKVVGRPIWSFFWEDAKKRIPLAWRNFTLVFGDVFVNKDGAEFLLVFAFKGKWCFSFEQIEDIANLPGKSMFVCLIDANKD